MLPVYGPDLNSFLHPINLSISAINGHCDKVWYSHDSEYRDSFLLRCDAVRLVGTSDSEENAAFILCVENFGV